MKRSTVIYLFSISLLLTACDPARILVVKAADKPNVSVSIYANSSILPSRDREDKEKTEIRIPTNDPVVKQDTSFFFGLGFWDDDEIAFFTENVDSIIINNSKGKLTLQSKKDINHYLLKHRSGYLKSRLTIEAK